MMGVFGMLAIALMVFVLRQTSDDSALGRHREVHHGRLLGHQRRPGDDGDDEPVPGRRAAGLGRGRSTATGTRAASTTSAATGRT